MTAKSFCWWVNDGLLPSQCISKSALNDICSYCNSMASSARISPTVTQEGFYVDDHEREDVVKSCEEFLKKLKELKDSHLPQPPDQKAATPPSDAETRKKLALLYHNELMPTKDKYGHGQLKTRIPQPKELHELRSLSIPVISTPLCGCLTTVATIRHLQRLHWMLKWWTSNDPAMYARCSVGWQSADGVWWWNTQGASTHHKR